MLLVSCQDGLRVLNGYAYIIGFVSWLKLLFYKMIFWQGCLSGCSRYGCIYNVNTSIILCIPRPLHCNNISAQRISYFWICIPFLKLGSSYWHTAWRQSESFSQTLPLSATSALCRKRPSVLPILFWNQHFGVAVISDEGGTGVGDVEKLKIERSEHFENSFFFILDMVCMLFQFIIF